MIRELNGGVVDVHRTAQIRGSLQADSSIIKIGAGVVMNRACIIRASEGADVTIGDECLFSDVQVLSSDLHSILDAETGQRLNPVEEVVIGDRVWLGTRVIVLPGSTIGCDSMVGAGAIVTGYIPPNSVAVGNPARVVRTGVRWVRDRV